MSLLNSMKRRLGFSNEEGYDDGYYEEGYDEDGYYEGDMPDDQGYSDDRVPAAREYRSRASRDETSIRVVPRTSSDDSSRRSRYGASSYGSPSYGTGDVGRQSPYDDAASFPSSNARRSSSVSEPEFMKNRPSREFDARGITARESNTSVRGGVSSAQGRPMNPADRDTRKPMAILKPMSYADAEQIVKEYKGNKDVVLVLGETRPELAKRILDFSFGVVSALGGTVEKVADKVFWLAHVSGGLTQDARQQLVDAGILPASDEQR